MNKGDVKIERLRNGHIRVLMYKDGVMHILRFTAHELYIAWRNAALLVLVLAGGCMSSAAKADDMAAERIAAHIGMSYILMDVTSAFGKKAMHMSNLQAETFAAGVTIFTGLVYKCLENSAGSEALRSTGYNAIGVGTHMLFHLNLEF